MLSPPPYLFLFHLLSALFAGLKMSCPSIFCVRLLLLFFTCAPVINGDSLDSIHFPSDEPPKPPLQPPRNGSQTTHPEVRPRSWFNTGDHDRNEGDSGNSFNVHPSSNGGFSGSGSFSSNYVGHGHSAGQSNSFSFSAGDSSGGGASFSSSHAASQSSSFNDHGGNRGPSLAASQASSQSSSFSGTSAGVAGGGGGGAWSSASSQAASVGLSGPGVAGAGANRNNNYNNIGASLAGSRQPGVSSSGWNVGSNGGGRRDEANIIPVEFVRSYPSLGNQAVGGIASDIRQPVSPIYDLHRQYYTPFIRTPTGSPIRHR